MTTSSSAPTRLYGKAFVDYRETVLSMITEPPKLKRHINDIWIHETYGVHDNLLDKYSIYMQYQQEEFYALPIPCDSVPEVDSNELSQEIRAKLDAEFELYKQADPLGLNLPKLQRQYSLDNHPENDVQIPYLPVSQERISLCTTQSDIDIFEMVAQQMLRQGWDFHQSRVPIQNPAHTMESLYENVYIPRPETDDPIKNAVTFSC